jgi:peptidyl-Lys metalloendopeptidase
MRVTATRAAIALVLALSACVAGDDGEPAIPDETVEPSAGALVSRVEVVGDWLGETDRLLVRWTLANHGLETVLLPRWEVPGSDFEDDLFELRRDGEVVPFVGKHYKRAAPAGADLVALEPGRSLSAIIDLSSLYLTNEVGEYTIVQRGGEPALRSNQVAAIRFAPAFDLDGSQARAALVETNLVAPAYRNCSSTKQSQIASALSQADVYAANALAYMNAGTAGPRYTTWFGAYSSSRFNTVKQHFSTIRSAVASKKITFDCGCTNSAYAYVYPNSPYVIYLCNAFWSAPTKGTDSKAGTIIHELAHFNVVAGTDDWAYGQGACKNLAKSNPTRAVDNSDSHEYFVENTPAQN